MSNRASLLCPLALLALVACAEPEPERPAVEVFASCNLEWPCGGAVFENASNEEYACSYAALGEREPGRFGYVYSSGDIHIGYSLFVGADGRVLMWSTDNKVYEVELRPPEFFAACLAGDESTRLDCEGGRWTEGGGVEVEPECVEP